MEKTIEQWQKEGGRQMEEGEEERATTVPHREGKAKSQWTVASLPRYTKRRPGLHVLSEIVQ